jgi:predicted RNase H-like HicB family nuclease
MRKMLILICTWGVFHSVDNWTSGIEAAMARARYEIIDDEEPYYGEIPQLKGIWETGKTLEECRKRLSEVIEGWIIVRLKRGLPIPPLGKYRIKEPKEISISG